MAIIPVPQTFGLEQLYVQGVTHHEFLDDTFEGVIYFEDKPAADTTSLMAVTVKPASGIYVFPRPVLVDGSFGRDVAVVGDGTAGTVTIYGRDYLNVPVSRLITTVDDTAVSSVKTFKYLDRIEWGTFTGTISIGRGNVYGLPFCARAVLAEYDGNTSQTLGTFVAPVTTDPATSATGDVRGTYNPTTVENGVKDLWIKIAFNPLGAYGLYGVPQA